MKPIPEPFPHYHCDNDCSNARHAFAEPICAISNAVRIDAGKTLAQQLAKFGLCWTVSGVVPMFGLPRRVLLLATRGAEQTIAPSAGKSG